MSTIHVDVVSAEASIFSAVKQSLLRFLVSPGRAGQFCPAVPLIHAHQTRCRFAGNPMVMKSLSSWRAAFSKCNLIMSPYWRTRNPWP